MRPSLAALTVLFLPLIVRAAGLTDDVEGFVKQQMEARHFPGASVGILKDGKVLLAQGYGHANVETDTPATTDTVYGILSVTKQFTAAAILLLDAGGKLALDDPLAKYLPDMPETWRPVTVRQLLAHASGIPEYTDVPDFFTHIRDAATPQELLAPVEQRPLQFAPGTGSRYSNSNYYLLGLIVERVTKESLAECLDERVFTPAAMHATRLNDPRDIIPNRAGAYQWIGTNVDRPPPVVSGYHGCKNVLQNAIYVSPTRLWAAGGAVSSVNDLLRWEQTLDAGKVLTPALRAEMARPFRLADGSLTEFGLGVELGEIKGHRFSGCQGNGIGCNAAVLRFAGERVTVIVLCNGTTAPSMPIAMHIAGLVSPELHGLGPLP